jgi:hypothetical protein
LHLTGQPASTEATIPSSLKGLPWELIQSVAVQGGYDLRPYVGKPVMLLKHEVVEESDGHRQRLVTIELDSHVIGAYVAVDDMVPGISGVGNPRN